MKPTSRLAYLSKMLIRYANSWYSNRGGNGPSCRMFSWVDEYNSLRIAKPTTSTRSIPRKTSSPNRQTTKELT
jgi:hypothetical protein